MVEPAESVKLKGGVHCAVQVLCDGTRHVLGAILARRFRRPPACHTRLCGNIPLFLHNALHDVYV